ncbi:MAG: ferritin family protein [Clostridia bacterium]
MQIRSEQEALFVACEMETTAVQLYRRALRVMDERGRQNEPLYEELTFMQSDEEGHLQQFRALYTGLEAPVERQLTLSAVAEGVLFEGGLMGAARQGLLDDVEGMLHFAMEAERTSAQKYREFAQLATNEQARATLLLIAAEEDKHLSELMAQAE